MDERINLLLSYEQNYYNDKEITPFSDRLDTELNQIKNYLDKIRFLKLIQLSIDKHILKIGERPVNVNQLTENRFEKGEFSKSFIRFIIYSVIIASRVILNSFSFRFNFI